jgi:hypothetical protein
MYYILTVLKVDHNFWSHETEPHHHRLEFTTKASSSGKNLILRFEGYHQITTNIISEIRIISSDFTKKINEHHAVDHQRES